MMRTVAAVARRGQANRWKFMEVTSKARNAAPKVLIEDSSDRLCHTDGVHPLGRLIPMGSSLHSSATRAPGIVMEVGDGVTTLEVGDHR